MDIIVFAALSILIKLAFTLVWYGLTKNKLSRLSRKQKGAALAGLWGLSVAGAKLMALVL
ncbi:hypothetical protein PGO58_16410 [Klebsiella aerogenes]|nr:hypothetical protein [Klebsiella aerogenes]